MQVILQVKRSAKLYTLDRMQCQAPADTQCSCLVVTLIHADCYYADLYMQTVTKVQEESMNYKGAHQHFRSSLITTSHPQRWQMGIVVYSFKDCSE